MSKARDLADSAQEINILDGKSFLDEDNLASDSATGIASQQSIKAYVDGITTTNITSTGALNSGSITSGFGNINNGSSTITTTGAITGGSFVIGSADINENDLESIDGITAGTVSASKAVVVNTNKDITGFRNLTATGTISGTLSGSLSSTTTATTQAESDDSTKIATTAYVVDKITTLIGGAPSTLNDLNELAAAINDDANYNSTLTTALATKLPLAGGTMTGDVLYNDNIKAKFGAGSDLQIYHDGSHSYVKDAGTGNLKIQGENVAIENTSGDLALYYVNTGVNLYHNNSAKLATTSTGIDVTGNTVTDKVQTENLYRTGVNGSGIHFSTNATLPTNETSAVSNGTEDLGSNAYRWKDLHLSGSIANSSGNLTLDASGILNLDSAFSSGTTGGIIRLNDAGTQFGDLYEDSGNFLIASAQVDKDIIFKGNDGGGIVTALTLDMSNGGQAVFNKGASFQDHVYLQDNDKLVLGNSDDLQIYHDGSRSIIQDSGTGNLRIQAANLELNSWDNAENYIFCQDNGAVTLYYDNAAKLATSSSGVTVTGTVAATSYTGDGSNLTGVGGSTTWDAVGTYAAGVLWRPNAVNPGATESGSNIRACQFDGINSSGYTLSGTWRAMGYTNQGYRGTVWVRIS